jgi:hypothetical protein
MRRLLIDAAKDLEKGTEPPCLDPSLPYDLIGTPDKVLMPGEDWTQLGSENDSIMNKLREEWVRDNSAARAKVDPRVMMTVPAPRVS